MNNQGPSQEDLSAPLLHQQSNNTNMPRQQKLSPKSDDSSSASGDSYSDFVVKKQMKDPEQPENDIEDDDISRISDSNRSYHSRRSVASHRSTGTGSRQQQSNNGSRYNKRMSDISIQEEDFSDGGNSDDEEEEEEYTDEDNQGKRVDDALDNCSASMAELSYSSGMMLHPHHGKKKKSRGDNYDKSSGSDTRRSNGRRRTSIDIDGEQQHTNSNKPSRRHHHRSDSGRYISSGSDNRHSSSSNRRRKPSTYYDDDDLFNEDTGVLSTTGGSSHVSAARQRYKNRRRNSSDAPSSCSPLIESLLSKLMELPIIGNYVPNIQNIFEGVNMKTVAMCIVGMFVVMKLNTNNNNVGPNVHHGMELHNSNSGGSNNDNVGVRGALLTTDKKEEYAKVPSPSATESATAETEEERTLQFNDPKTVEYRYSEPIVNEANVISSPPLAIGVESTDQLQQQQQQQAVGAPQAGVPQAVAAAVQPVSGTYQTTDGSSTAQVAGSGYAVGQTSTISQTADPEVPAVVPVATTPETQVVVEGGHQTVVDGQTQISPLEFQQQQQQAQAEQAASQEAAASVSASIPEPADPNLPVPLASGSLDASQMAPPPDGAAVGAAAQSVESPPPPPPPTQEEASVAGVPLVSADSPASGLPQPSSEKEGGGDTTAVATASDGVEGSVVGLLNNFKDAWDPYEKTDIPMFWHIPKAGGSSIKDAMGGCHRFVQATEFGVTDGHDTDTEVAIVYPAIPGVADTDRSPFVNIDSTTPAGIARAKSLGFADAQLAQVVVSPFVFETNELFTQTAKGRLFSVFRHPIDRAVSMFYYIRVADWEPSYSPEMKEWTIDQYATSDKIENNWMTRQLTNQLGGELTDENLNRAMEVVRTKFMVGLMSQIEPTMARFEKYFRWTYHVNPPNQEACRERLMSGGSNSNKSNKEPVDENHTAWPLLALQNNYDLQLYAYIEQLFAEQEAFVSGLPDEFRKVDGTCCKCDPPTFPPEGFTCPQAVKNA